MCPASKQTPLNTSYVFGFQRETLYALYFSSLVLIELYVSYRYPFRQNSNFLYLTGYHEPDSVLIVGKYWIKNWLYWDTPFTE